MDWPPYIYTRRVDCDHVRVDALVREAGLALEVGRVAAGAMVRNQQRFGRVDLVVGWQMDPVSARTAAAIKAKLSRFSDEIVRCTASRRGATLDSRGMYLC